MIKASNKLSSLLHPFGAAGPARVRASDGTSASKTKLLLTLAAITTFFAFTASALAAKQYALTAQFGAEGTGTGQFSGPAGVAVNDATKDVYVVDQGNNRVQYFTAAGAYLGEFNGSGLLSDEGSGSPLGVFPGQFSSPETIAVDNDASSPSHGDVYVADDGHGAIDEFSATGEYKGQLTGTCASAGTCPGSVIPFAALQGVAVDPEGNVWVYDESGNLDEFSDTGSFVKTFNTGYGGERYPGLAVDSSHDAYVVAFDYVAPGHHAVVKFDSSTGAEDFAFGGVLGSIPSALAVDPATNDVFVDSINEESRASSVSEYAPSAAAPSAPLATFPSAGLTDTLSESDGVAVSDDSTGTAYATQRAADDVEIFNDVVLPTVETGAATSLQSEGSATLNGTVDPEGEPVTSCEFEYGTETSYGATAPCSPSPGSSPTAVAVSAHLVGLVPDTVYHYRLVAANANAISADHGEDRTFTAPARPAIGEQSATDVASTSATLSAQLNPGGAITTYRVEYVSEVQFAAHGYAEATDLPVPEGDAGSGLSPVTLSVHVQGLRAGTTYHYRFVASNIVAQNVAGSEQTFTTQRATGAFNLPDGREWEMVSLPDKHGALIEPINIEGIIQAASSGDAFTYFTDAPTEAEPQGYTTKMQVLATRNSAGWSDRDMETSHDDETGTPVGFGYEFRFFSSELSQAVIEPEGEFTPLTGEETPPGATERTLYLRDNGMCQATPSTCYTPLLTAANTPPGTKFGPGKPAESTLPLPEGYVPPVEYFGATPDATHVLLRSDIPLTSPPVTGEGEGSGALYEWAAGHVQLVSILPEDEGGQQTANAYFGGYSNNGREAETRNAISEDGSRIIWSTSSSHPDALYMRDMLTEETIRLDTVQGGTGEEPGTPLFDIASSNGSVVFFTDTQHLTKDSGGQGSRTPEESDLYACQIVEVDEKPGCKLTDLTPIGPSGEQAAVQGAVLGASEDGAYVYFVANGVLGDGVGHGATPGDCEYHPAREEAEKRLTRCNLYVEHYDDESKVWEAPHFIATVSGADEPDWAYANLRGHTSRVSGNGRFLAFMSQRALTGYDNLDARSGEPDEEVYLYDAESERLTCAS